MRTVFFSLVILISLGFLWFRAADFSNEKIDQMSQDLATEHKIPILKFALVADSENDNENLKKALSQAKESGVNFVIGLGDWSSIGTVSELSAAKKVFDQFGMKYYVTAGDHDLWDSRNRGEDALTNYRQVFGEPSGEFETKGIYFVILDNSDIYKGIDAKSLSQIAESPTRPSKLKFVFAHKTPFHPQSSHIMGEENEVVAGQAKQLIKLIEENKIDGFFSGDLHFFAEFSSKGGSTASGKSPDNTVKITTIGAIDAKRNFQGPRFAIVSVFDDLRWNVEDVEIR